MNELFEILKSNLFELIFGAAGVVAWLKDRSKLKAEIESLKIDNLTKSTEKDVKIIDLYQEALDDLKKRFDERNDEIKKDYEYKFNQLSEKHNTFIESLRRDYENKIGSLEEEVKSVRTNLELWKNKYRKLQEEIDKNSQNQ